MEQKKANIKPLSYRMRPEVREFIEGNAAKTYRSAQGMLDYILDRVIEMEKKGDFVI
ncbi:hypothetical protein [Lonsdalea britannica]|uniref:hypothetical protein n=1 Tax=Lonsdalea britannica TaxID=1082704 RepID=UPI0026F2DD32|nr:hypothetical protein [Lonsdalea britannica]